MNHDDNVPALYDVRLLRTDILDPKIVKQNWFLSRKHIINTEDSLVQLGPLTIDWAYYSITEVMVRSVFRNPEMQNAVFENILTLDNSA